MATVQVQKHKKHRAKEQAPQEFIDDCKALEPDFEKTKPKVLKIYNKWIEKGKKPKTVGKWLRDQLREWYSPQGMLKLIPKEAHRSYIKDGSHSKKHEDFYDSKLTQSVNSNTSSTLESQKQTEKPSAVEKIGSVRTEPKKTHSVAAPGKWNQGADEYEIGELDQYDIDYLRIIVRWLHQLRMDFIKEAFKWQTKFDMMQKEKKELIAKLEAHGIK